MSLVYEQCVVWSRSSIVRCLPIAYSTASAISADSVIALSRLEVFAPTSKKRKTTGPAPKKGTTGSNFSQFIEEVLTSNEVSDLRYKYLVMDNASIHNTTEVKFWIAERGHQLLFLPPYSPFLNPIEEFWAKLKDVVNKDPAIVRKNTLVSDQIKDASVKISRQDCQGWIRHSLTFWKRCLAQERGL